MTLCLALSATTLHCGRRVVDGDFTAEALSFETREPDGENQNNNSVDEPGPGGNTSDNDNGNESNETPLFACVDVTPPSLATLEIRSTLEGTAESGFGAALALTGDHLIVGAPEDGRFGIGAGAVYLYPLGVDGLDREAVQILGAAQASDGASFGSAVVAQSGWVFVSALPSANSDGSVLAFRQFNPGEPFQFVEAISVTDAEGFGRALAFDGESLFVGARGAQGRVFVFALPELEEVQLIEGETDESNFGRLVSAESGRIAIASEASVHVYQLTNSEFVRDHSRAASEASAIALGDNVLFLGRTQVNDQLGEVTASLPDRSQRIDPIDESPRQRFGASIAVLPPVVAIGATHYDTINRDAGGAFVWVRRCVDGQFVAVARAGGPTNRIFSGRSVALNTRWLGWSAPNSAQVFIAALEGVDFATSEN
ncbi:MAG: hypothetical protein AAF654_00385 [Myxococcota bacterium]